MVLHPKLCFLLRIVASLVATQGNFLPTAFAVLDEGSRVAEYDKRYPRKWPPKDYVPNVEGWKNLHERRFSQIRELELDQGKYEGCAKKGRSSLWYLSELYSAD